MKCPNCKAQIEDNSKFCDFCGKEITENKNKVVKKDKITEEEYQKFYIGDNYYKFKNKFNLFAFLFGGIYAFYRKQYILGTIFIIIELITSIFTPFIILFLHLILGLAYNNQYISHVNKRISNIKIKYNSKSKEEILSICAKEGNPSMLSAVAAVVLILIAIVIILNVGGTSIKGSKGKTIVKVSDNKIGQMIYEVPEGFKSGNYNTDNYRAYTYNENTNYCRIKIETRKDNNKYSSTEAFLSDILFSTQTDTVTQPENVTINKELWKRVNVSNSKKTVTYYAIKYNDTYYMVLYELYNNNEFCNNEYNTFMNSLNFREQ